MEAKDCVALVTGGNHGIGEAFVRQLIVTGAGPERRLARLLKVPTIRSGR